MVASKSFYMQTVVPFMDTRKKNTSPCYTNDMYSVPYKGHGWYTLSCVLYIALWPSKIFIMWCLLFSNPFLLITGFMLQPPRTTGASLKKAEFPMSVLFLLLGLLPFVLSGTRPYILPQPSVSCPLRPFCPSISHFPLSVLGCSIGGSDSHLKVFVTTFLVEALYLFGLSTDLPFPWCSRSSWHWFWYPRVARKAS